MLNKQLIKGNFSNRFLMFFLVNNFVCKFTLLLLHLIYLLLLLRIFIPTYNDKIIYIAIYIFINSFFFYPFFNICRAFL